MIDGNTLRSLECVREYAVALSQYLKIQRQQGETIPTPLWHQYESLDDFAVDWWPHAPAEQVREIVRQAKVTHPVDLSPQARM